MRYLVLGTGRQGTAAAYDLAKFGRAKEVFLYDNNPAAAFNAEGKLSHLVRKKFSVVQDDDLGSVMKEADVHAAVCALPYFLGEKVAKLAVENRVPICDLGCDTGIVKKQLKLDKQARKARTAIVPDCGLAPGTSTMFAMYVYDRLRELKAKPESIRLYCGGLMQDQRDCFEPVDKGHLISLYDHSWKPLKYKIVFSPVGLINNYAQPAYVLANGIVCTVPSLEDEEPVSMEGRILEAFSTAGGASLLPWRFQKAGIKDFSYKTLRYPGHAKEMRLLRDLGLLDVDKPIVEEVWKSVITDKLRHEKTPDCVYLMAVGKGTSKKGPVAVTLSMRDLDDDNFSSMERTTGFAAGVVASMLAHGKIRPGVKTPDEAIKASDYVAELKKRGFRIKEAVEAPC